MAEFDLDLLIERLEIALEDKRHEELGQAEKLAEGF